MASSTCALHVDSCAFFDPPDPLFPAHVARLWRAFLVIHGRVPCGGLPLLCRRDWLGLVSMRRDKAFLFSRMWKTSSPSPPCITGIPSSGSPVFVPALSVLCAGDPKGGTTYSGGGGTIDLSDQKMKSPFYNNTPHARVAKDKHTKRKPHTAGAWGLSKHKGRACGDVCNLSPAVVAVGGVLVWSGLLVWLGPLCRSCGLLVRLSCSCVCVASPSVQGVAWRGSLSCRVGLPARV